MRTYAGINQEITVISNLRTDLLPFLVLYDVSFAFLRCSITQFRLYLAHAEGDKFSALSNCRVAYCDGSLLCIAVVRTSQC